MENDILSQGADVLPGRNGGHDAHLVSGYPVKVLNHNHRVESRRHGVAGVHPNRLGFSITNASIAGIAGAEGDRGGFGGAGSVGGPHRYAVHGRGIVMR